MILAAQDIRELIQNKNMIDGWGDLETQMQSNGFEFRLGRVYELELKNHGSVSYIRISGERHLPEQKVIADKDGQVVRFEKGKSYIIETKETLHMPFDVCGFIRMKNAVGIMGLRFNPEGVDAGFNGPLRFINTYCIESCELDIGTRFCQVIFAKLTRPTSKPYR